MAPTAHFKEIRYLLRQELAQAQSSIQVAVAWFTDQAIFDVLLQKAAEEVSVTLIIRNDVINVNPKGLNWQQLVDAPNTTLFFSNHLPPLHHKFCIIDGKQVISGSYNWTYAAQRNHENVVFFSQPEVVKDFRQAYDELLDHAREVTSVATLAFEQPPETSTALKEGAAMEVAFREQTKKNDQKEDEYDELVLAATADYLQKNYVAAEKLLQKALLVKPTGLDGYSLLAQLYWRTKQFDKSIVAAKQAEIHGLRCPELWNAFGLAHHGLKKTAEALRFYDRSIAEDPLGSTWRLNRYIALADLRQETQSENAALNGIRVASDEIKQHKDGSNEHALLRAYIVRANLRSDPPEARKDVKAAKEIFDRIPFEEQDLHDLDDINDLLKELQKRR